MQLVNTQIMVPFVGFPDTPPLGELADGSTGEGSERVERGETIGSDGEGEDKKVGCK